MPAAAHAERPIAHAAATCDDYSTQAEAQRAADTPELAGMLNRFPATQRVELKDVAADIRARGSGRALTREELLVLMLDSYRAESRDLV